MNCKSNIFPITRSPPLTPPYLAFFLTAHFSEEDFPYDWLMLWLSRRPEWQRSREFETTTRTALPGGSSNSSSSANALASSYRSAEDDDWDQWEVAVSGNSGNIGGEGGPGEDGEGRPKTRVVFQPTYDTTHTIFYKGHWLRVRRGRKQETGSEMLSIRYFFSVLSYLPADAFSHQCRCTFQCYSQTTGPSSQKGIRSRSYPSHPNIFRRCSWFMALD